MTSHFITPLVVNRTINAPREKVFQAWADPQLLSRWLGGNPDNTRFISVDFRVGGMYQIDMAMPDGTIDRLSGIYEEIDIPNRIVFSWGWGASYSADEATLVTVEFTEEDKRTHIKLTHERFTDQALRNIHAEGWVICFSTLEAILLNT